MKEYIIWEWQEGIGIWDSPAWFWILHHLLKFHQEIFIQNVKLMITTKSHHWYQTRVKKQIKDNLSGENGALFRMLTTDDKKNMEDHKWANIGLYLFNRDIGIKTQPRATYDIQQKLGIRCKIQTLSLSSSSASCLERVSIS